MTQEEKQILLKDLCARLPHKILCTDLRHGDSVVTSIDLEDGLVYCFDFDEWVEIGQCKPYLRPMSSMTEEEKELMKGSVICFNELEGNSTLFDEIGFDWLNAHHFDYRGLIPMGLALEAPEGMYK